MATKGGESGGRSEEESAPARARLEATGLALGVPSLQSVVLDQIMPAAEDGCWTPGRDMVRPMLNWVCDTFAFETAYDLLQSFPRFCKYRNNRSCQQRTCENLLIDFFPERMDFTRKRRLHCSWVGENKDYTRDEWLQVLHQESRGRYEMEYRLLRRVVHETLPSLDVEFRKQDEASRKREAAYRRKKEEEEEERKRQREEEEAAEKKRKQEESAADGDDTENLHPNRRRRSRR